MIATIAAVFLTSRISADRQKQRQSAFRIELNNLVAQAGTPSRSELAHEARSHITSPPTNIGQQIDRALGGVFFPTWLLAKAIIEACIAIAAGNHIGLAPDATDVAAWEDRYNRALRPSFPTGRSWATWALILAVAALTVSAIVPINEWFSRSATAHPSLAPSERAPSSHSSRALSKPTRPTGSAVSVVEDVDPKRTPPKPIHEVNVVDGQEIEIVQTSGEWNCATDHYVFTGAEGDPKHAGLESDYDKAHFLVPGRPICMLVGRIGSGPWFAVGKNRTITADRSGELQLTANEIPPHYCVYPTVPPPDTPNTECYDDNQGTISVRITVR
jgi:hypothetical protein